MKVAVPASKATPNHDRGGNDTQVRPFDYGSNLHKVWDRDMIEWIDNMEDFWLADLAELDIGRTAPRG
jgi:hypothetical protein